MRDSSVSFKPKKSLNQLRSANRLELRPSDGIAVNISSHKLGIQSGRVFDITPSGACIIFESKLPETFQPGGEIKLEFVTADAKSLLTEGVIKWRGKFKGTRDQVGIKFNLNSAASVSWQNTDFVKVPEFAPIVGAMYKPYLFFERAPLRLEKVGQEIWQLRIYDTELLILPGLKFEVFLQLTSATDEAIVVEVLDIGEVENNSVIVNVAPTHIPLAIKERITQQLVFSEAATPDELRKVGYRARNLSNGFRFRYVKTQEEYEEVLKLRFLAYSECGKVAAGKSFLDMTAPLDSISRIIAVYHGTRIVGSVAVAFPMSEDTVLDTEKPFAGGYPYKMGRKTDMIEVARLCTDPAYRKSDLMTRILEHIYKALICGGRKLVITSTDDKLWPSYKKLGFEKTGMSYDHPFLAGIRHHIIIQAAPKADLARGINLLSWNFIWRDMSRHLEDQRLIKLTGLGFLKVRLYEQIGRLLKINLKAKY